MFYFCAVVVIIIIAVSPSLSLKIGLKKERIAFSHSTKDSPDALGLFVYSLYRTDTGEEKFIGTRLNAITSPRLALFKSLPTTRMVIMQRTTFLPRPKRCRAHGIQVAFVLSEIPAIFPENAICVYFTNRNTNGNKSTSQRLEELALEV